MIIKKRKIIKGDYGKLITIISKIDEELFHTRYTRLTNDGKVDCELVFYSCRDYD